MKSLVNKIAIFVAVMALVAGAAWFGRKAYKKTMERRLISQGKEALEKKDLRGAALFAQRAVQVNPMSSEASTLMGDFLEDAGLTNALAWRIRAAKLDPKNMNLRFKWARAAVELHDVSSATEALDGLDPKSMNSSEYHKLKGALAWSTHNGAEAEKEYSEAKQLEPANPVIDLNLATIHLASTDAAVAGAARATLDRLATNAALRSAALHQLFMDATARQSVTDATNILARIVQDSSASLADKIEYLELLHRIKSAEFPHYLASLERASTNSPQYAFAVGRWKAGVNATNALHWLQSLPLEVQTNQPVPLVITDCQIAIKDWNGILALVQKEDWGEADYYKLALESLAERSLNKKLAADDSWRKSLRACVHRPDRLAHLAQITGVWGWTAERTEVLRETIDESPSASWAVNQLADQYYAAGNIGEMEALYSKMYSRDPSDPRVKNNLATLYMLRKTDLDKAYQMAREAYNSSTNNPFFASTYAYALLLQNKKDKALEIVDRLKGNSLQIPSIALYYGAVQAAAGNKNKAEPAIKRAESAKLLPEERQIVQVAKASL